MTRALGIDIGGSKIAAGIVDEHGALEGPPLFVTTPAADGADAVVAAVLDAARAALGTSSADAVGIGSAGTFDERGTVASATGLLRGWTGTPLAELVSSALGAPVIAINDVHAAAASEALVGAGTRFDSVLVVAVGTGVGGAIVRNGQVERGATGTAGSIGHVPGPGGRECSCGVADHIEPWVSGPGLERSFFEADGEALPLREIAALAAAGDELALRVILEGATMLGRAIAGAVNLLDPAAIVLGGGVADIGEPYRAAVAAAILADALPGPGRAPVLAAALGNRAAIVGAALVALARNRPGADGSGR